MRFAGLFVGLLVCGCASGSGASLDAGLDATATADAPGSIIDADPAAPDASTIDAVAASDASPGTPDATPPPPDANAPDAAPPDACVPEWIQLLGNPGFESGNSTWAATSNGGDIIRTGNSPWPPHAGTWQALFLGFNNASQSLTQTVTVPSDATALRFSAYQCFVTDESSTTTAYDTLVIELKEGATLLQELKNLSNLDAGATCAWTAMSVVNLASAHAGKTVTLHMIGGSDLSTATSFGVDTVALEAFACP